MIFFGVKNVYIFIFIHDAFKKFKLILTCSNKLNAYELH